LLKTDTMTIDDPDADDSSVTVALIYGPDGRLHYRRPPEHPDVAEARDTPGYRVEVVTVEPIPDTPEAMAAVERELADAEPVPLSPAAIRQMTRYATDPDFRAMYERARDAERALEESEADLCRVRHLGWLAWCGWANQKSDFAERMTRLRDAVKPKHGDKSREGR
jgi:hypothetical protein